MRYYMRQNLFSLKDKYKIYNEDERITYTIDANWQILNFRCNILDENNEICAKVSKEMISVLPKYQIYTDTDVIANVSMRLSFFKKNFDISSKFGNISMEGDFFSFNFKVLKNGKLVATVDKQFIKMTDCYVINVLDNIQPEFIIALAVIVDNALHNDNQ